MASSLFVLLSALLSLAVLWALAPKPTLQLKRIPPSQQRRRRR
jgi:hypothetical protein